MNRKILEPEIQTFINSNWHLEVSPILLKKQVFEGVTQKELVQQLESKKKCRQKLPTWFTTPNIYYPDKVNIAQSSSESMAQYKSGLVQGKTLVDLTGGFGVDSYYFSNQFKDVVHCEKDQLLSEIAAYNFKVLQKENIECFSSDGLRFLQQRQTPVDWIYLDPSRRDSAQKRVFRLQDCEPDVSQHMDLFFAKSVNLLIKTAPLLDISTGLAELKYVKEIHIVALKNEVKELLWVLENGYSGAVAVRTINFTNSKIETFEFAYNDEYLTQSTFGDTETYLYEPNAAILKSGGFKVVGERYGLKKLHLNSHLYTSSKLWDFPGRRFQITSCLEYSKKNLRNLPRKANITIRNFPETVSALRKKTQIQDGGDIYLFFTTETGNRKIILECTKV